MGALFSSLKGCFSFVKKDFAKAQAKAVKKVIKHELKKIQFIKYRSKSI